MPMLQYVASLSATPPSGGVRIDFLRYSHGSAAIAALPWAIICRLAMRRGSQIPLACGSQHSDKFPFIDKTEFSEVPHS